MNKDEAHQKLNDHLSKHQLKNTQQRKDIVDAFLKLQGQHVTIDELLEACRKTNPAIGYATVYRTLKLLIDAGIAEQRQFQSGQSQFELESDKHHDHLICTHCNRIIEFENKKIESLQDQVAKDFSFELSHHKMMLYGVCSGLKKTGVCTFDSTITHKD